MTQDDRAWRTACCVQLLTRSYGDETVVFDAGSGSTLTLDPIAADALHLIAAEPQTKGQLMAKISNTFDLPADAALENYLDSLIDSLLRQHLIEPAAE